MPQYTIERGSRSVVITRNSVGQPCWLARLYVSHGETATLACWRGKTEAGARRWAQRSVTPPAMCEWLVECAKRSRAVLAARNVLTT